MRTIAILTGSSLEANPRALKEAAALARAGYRVTVHGSSNGAEQLERDRSLASDHGFTFRAAIGDRNGQSEILRSKLAHRLGRELHRSLRIENRWQLGASTSQLLRVAMDPGVDYAIAHMEQALWACTNLLEAGKPFGVDMEDWHSEDLLPADRRQRPLALLRWMEAKVLRHAGHATCPSFAMSAALASEFQVAPPTVVYNAFPWADRRFLDNAQKDRTDLGTPSLHWVSQTLGPGRGLEELFRSLPLVAHPLQIHLRGRPANRFDAWLACAVPPEWAARVHVHPPVSSRELLSRIAEHDIGFAGEQPHCRSRDLTVTNKILHYMLGGLAVVASDTRGQTEVAAQSKGGVLLYQAGDACSLATQLNALLAFPGHLADSKAIALGDAQRHFSWEQQEAALLAAIDKAVG